MRSDHRPVLVEARTRSGDSITFVAEKIKTLPGTIPIFAVVAIIFSAMAMGWATPTEAGALGAFVVLLIALARGMRWGPWKKRCWKPPS